jgi:TPP-dependent trihydroxycyclohexane-1,2-dione (THcHDO) dehydratase
VAERLRRGEQEDAMTKTIRLTMAQALVRALAAQETLVDGAPVPVFAGCWAIFGHGNVAGLGEALHAARDMLPTFRSHNEQAMAHAAVAFAKASRRRRMMAVTSSIGPGATNMITAAAVAHVNRLPVLFLPGDVFANRRPDPVLQQVDPRLRARHAGADRSGGLRAGDAVAVPGRADRGLRLARELLRAAPVEPAPSAAGRP